MIGFESMIRDLFADGELPYLIHLGGGNEEQLINIFEEVQWGDWVLASHRNHFHALLSGVDPWKLRSLISEGNSMFVYENPQLQTVDTHGRFRLAKVNFLTSAILGGTCGIAAGIALAIHKEQGPENVWCFLGDGAADNGHLFEAAMLVESRGLPCTFIIEDNDRSVDTTKEERRGPRRINPFAEFACVRTYQYKPTYPHGGAGLTKMIEFKKEAVQRYLDANKLNANAS